MSTAITGRPADVEAEDQQGRSQPSRPLLATLAVVSIVWTLYAEWIYYRALSTGLSEAALIALLDGLTTLSFALIGLVVWHGRPDSRIGPLMYATGVAQVIGNLAQSSVPVVVYLADWFQSAWHVGLGVIVLTYPSGRIRHRVDAWLLGVASIWIVVTGWWSVAGENPAGCLVCQPNPFFVDVDATTRAAGDTFTSIGVLVLWLAFALRVAVRWRRTGPVGRRALRPLLAAGLVAATAQILSAVAQMTVDEISAIYVQVFLATPAAVVVPVALGFGLLRGRLDQASVGELVVRVGDGRTDDDLERAVSGALGDPTLRIAIPTGDGSLVAIDGSPIGVPGPDRQVTRITSGGHTSALLIHDPDLEANPGLVQSVGAATRLALENARLTEEVRRQLDEVRASRARIVEASDAERERIERNLHDGAQQRLVALALRLRAMGPAADPATRDELTVAADDLDAALAELRELARGIHPTAVTQSGLAAAIESLAERAPIPVEVDAPATRWPAAVEVAAWFVVAEALTNVARHARATSARVTVGEADDRLEITVRDDGVGGASVGPRSGLQGLADRMAAAGGELAVDSPPGGGTTVQAWIPVDAA